MKVSLKWLRTYTPASLPPEELAQRLTMAGVEVADIYRFGENWNNVYVGEITALHPHPNADRLQLVDVNYGPGRDIRVVTGATNIAVGNKVPLALVGARLIDTHVNPPELRELKPVKLRGVVSEGMVCSARELALGEDHAGILLLDQSAVPGTPLAEELGDVIFDLDVTPNRVDLFSMIGVAREVATLLNEPLEIPTPGHPGGDPAAGELVDVTIVEPELAPRYMAGVIQGVKIGESPKWLKERLTAAGLRPINNVVDVTNYVMLEWGQPLHAFDYDKLRAPGHQKQIIVRPAREGEKLTLLDGSEATLTPSNLVIADAEGAVAVAGVMGGANSEVTAETRNLLLESANFNPISVRRTARALRQVTEAAHRFERGLPRQLPEPALFRAVELILQTAGGTAASGVVDQYPLPTTLPEISLTPAEVKRILGIELSREKIAEIFTRARCLVAPQGEGVKVVPPMQRTDLQIPADLCEEIARIIGYEAIPATLPSGRPPEPTRNAEWEWKNALRQTLAGLGLDEVVTYALTSRERMARLLPPGEKEDPAGNPPVAQPSTFPGPAALGQAVTERFAPLHLEPVEVLNPLSRESECMRLTSFSNLLETVRANLRVADENVLLFEIGRIYIPRTGNLPEERKVLTVAAGGTR
ncbi:MAG TPA: phenylalanine--tRNA ligase subunit beta, partial [Chloroflexota bacterium]|nr:phenylalanine--tRNA ligase subunit beta [Chloroflexota bacterium]